MRQSGVTLIELLLALLISAIVVAEASSLFMSGHKFFLARRNDSELLMDAYILKSKVKSLLALNEVAKCENGRLWLVIVDERTGVPKEKDIRELLGSKIALVDSSDFVCLEIEAQPNLKTLLQSSKRPKLVQFRFNLIINATRKHISGDQIL